MTNGFVSESRRYLRGEYLPKIRACLDRLTEDDVWWRPNDESNSIGNLLLHLAGNARQWIVSGVGGVPDTRQRQREFDERTRIPKAELLAKLTSALGDVDDVLAGLDAAVLPESRSIQGRTVTVFDAVYHVVEHFAMHTGQITYITKLRTSADLGFYRDADGLAMPTLSGQPDDD
ncbi:MAG TPA: DinB family protein [Gemmatimonadales bacterium]